MSIRPSALKIFLFHGTRVVAIDMSFAVWHSRLRRIIDTSLSLSFNSRSRCIKMNSPLSEQGIHADRRLVQDQKFRVVHQSHGEGYSSLLSTTEFKKIFTILWPQVGFAELKKSADDRANISGTIIGAPIVSQQLAQYILTHHQDADCRPMIRLILSRQL